MRLPETIEGVTTSWLAHVLLGSGLPPIVASRILEVMHGTATKIHIELTFPDGAARTIWLKTGFENHSHEIGQDTVYAGEVYYYTHLAGRYDTQSPHCFYTHHEPDTGNSVIIMEDILPQKPCFFEPVRPISPDVCATALATLARFHAASWNSDFLTTDRWLSSGGAYTHSNVLGWLYSDDNWALMSGLPRFKVLPQILRARDLLRDTHARLLGAWRESANPFCLSHGDAHIGQGYLLPDGSVNFLDWQCVMKNSWANDVAYFMISALSLEDRRAHQQDLLRGYLAALVARGASAPDFAESWRLYKTYAFHGLGWVFCKPEMQNEDNCSAIGDRFAAAVMDLDSIKSVQGAPIVAAGARA